jgi:hypothetical protein
MRRILCTLDVLIICTFLSGSFAAGAEEKQPTVYVSFWFDTEDFILPAADDAAKRLAEIFTSQGVKATFKIVGEKARVLRDRGRDDVILALSKNDIGYHAEYHSIHPTPAEYEQQLGWDDGVKAFMRREGRGVEDLKKIFGVVPSCYGQAGGSWVPQSYAAMRNWGILLYLDETSHVGLNGEPFWYCGILNVLNLDWRVTRTGLGGEEELKDGCRRFDEVHARLLKEGGGIISIYYHPCEWVHKQFWDGVNFSRGANPRQEDWKLPPQKSAEETERAFDCFAKYLEHVRTRPNVQLVTAREIPALYPDRAYQRPFARDELLQMAKHIQKEVTFVRFSDRAVSAAEILYLLGKAVTKFGEFSAQLVLTRFFREGEAGSIELAVVPPPGRTEGASPPPIGPFAEKFDLKFLYGPSSLWTDMVREGEFPLREWIDACRDFLEEAEDLGRIPSVVWVAGKPVAPEDFAASLGAIVDRIAAPSAPLQGFALTESAKFPILRGKFTAGKYVAEDNPGLWGWVIFPENFRAPKMMDLARLQAWTLKPAILLRPPHEN